MTYRYTVEDVRYIQDLYGNNFTQAEMNAVYHRRRTEAGTQTKRGDYTNWISKLSPNSKHLAETVTTAAKGGVVDVYKMIMSCMDCNKKEAKKIYNTILVPLCPSGRFTMPNAAMFTSVLFQPPEACNSWITYAYLSPQYASDFEIEELDEWTNVFIFKTDRTYLDLLKGKITEEMILNDIRYGLRSMHRDNNQIPEMEAELLGILIDTSA